MTFASTVSGLSPAAWYRLGEASGSSMTDSSGNARNGTYGGSPWSVPALAATGLLHDGDTDTAAVFNGTTSEGEIAYNSAWMNLTTFSVFARIKPNTTSGNHTVVSRYVSSLGNAWVLRQDGTSMMFWYQASAGSYQSLTLGTVASGTEYSVGVVRGSGQFKVYFNGALAATVTNTVVSSTAGLIVGANWQGSPNEVFSGTLDEVVYWNSALSDADQSSLHSAATASAASGSASLTLSASGAGVAAAAGTATLTFGGSGGTGAGGAGTASLTFSATGGTIAPEPAAGTASLDLSASGAAGGAAAGTASLSLSASGTAVGAADAAGTALLTFSATGGVTLPAAGSAFLTLSAGGVAEAIYRTDTSNFMNGRRRGGLGSLEVFTPYTPPTTTPPVRVDKAVALPDPVLVNGRPT